MAVDWAGVKDLWFTTGDTTRGQALVRLKDRLDAFGDILTELYERYQPGDQPAPTLRDVRRLVAEAKLDIYEDEVTNHYLEVCGYPKDADGDECDDQEACAGVPCSLGQFAAVLVRLANAYLLANVGHCEMALDQQFTQVVCQH